MTDALSPAWIEAMVEASRDRQSVAPGGVVAITIGKTKRAVFEIDQGRVRAVPGGDEAASEGDDAHGEEPAVEVTIPVTGKQLTALVEGSESLAQAFMRGDIKPEGATGPLLAAIELFEDDAFRARLAEASSA